MGNNLNYEFQILNAKCIGFYDLLINKKKCAKICEDTWLFVYCLYKDDCLDGNAGVCLYILKVQKTIDEINFHSVDFICAVKWFYRQCSIVLVE